MMCAWGLPRQADLDDDRGLLRRPRGRETPAAEGDDGQKPVRQQPQHLQGRDAVAADQER